MHDFSSNDPAPTLHLVCGKIGAGKSTLSQQLALVPHPGEIHSIADYLQRAAALRSVLTDHLRALLQAGVSVVLDFPFNTPATRAWAREVFSPMGAAHQLHFLDVADEVCKARLRVRNARGKHPFQASDEEFEQIPRHFVAPAAEEGFGVTRYTQAGPA